MSRDGRGGGVFPRLQLGPGFRRLLSAGLAWIFLSTGAWAQILGGDANTVDPGRVEINYYYTGSDGEVSFDAAGNPTIRVAKHSDSHTLRLTIGLTPRMDLSVQTGEGFLSNDDGERYLSPTFGNGPDDSQLRLRLRLVDEEGLHIVTYTTVTVPTGKLDDDDTLGISQGFTSLTQGLVARQDFDRLSLWTELAYSQQVDRRPGFNTLSSSVGLGYMIDDWFQPTLEIGYVNSNPGNVQALSYVAGFTFLISPQVALQTGIQRTIYGVNSDDVTRPMIFLSIAP